MYCPKHSEEFSKPKHKIVTQNKKKLVACSQPAVLWVLVVAKFLRAAEVGLSAA